MIKSRIMKKKTQRKKKKEKKNRKKEGSKRSLKENARQRNLPNSFVQCAFFASSRSNSPWDIIGFLSFLQRKDTKNELG